MFLVLGTSNLCAENLRIGTALGLNIGFATASSNAGSPIIEASSRKGLVLGVVVQTKHQPVSIETGFRYIQTGATIDLVGILPGSIQLDLLQLPALGRWCSPTAIRFCAAAGINIGIAVNRSVEFLSLSIGDLSNRIGSVDFGLEGGVGVEGDFGPLTWSVEARLLWGISDLDVDANETYLSRNLMLLATSKVNLP